MSKPVPSRGHRWRCAIYTRKSSEEGLEQEFNSLHAQREACEAFITSQRHEGWICLPQAYDDGGLSGATIDRPALQQLLADIQQGRVDIVVCYKTARAWRHRAAWGCASEERRRPRDRRGMARGSRPWRGDSASDTGTGAAEAARGTVGGAPRNRRARQRVARLNHTARAPATTIAAGRSGAVCQL